MLFLQKRLYNLAIRSTVAGAWLAAPFSKKARVWVENRRKWRENLNIRRVSNPSGVAPTIWFHCASLGEFEQGRPVIEGFRQRFPDWKIALTFFSDSGLAQRRDWPVADLVAVLPADLPAAANDFQDILRPDMAVFVKYEFWANQLFELKRRGVPTFLISASFRKGQPFFHPLGGFWRAMLGCFDHVFVQNSESAKLMESIGFSKTTVAGDTRIDRVLGIAAEARRLPIVEAFLEERLAFVCGSTWEADEKILAPIFQQVESQGFSTIIAPHELSEAAFSRLEKQAPQLIVRYTKMGKNAEPLAARTLIVDNIGLLSTIYRYGKIAYVGGGFGAGIHNTLEPAAFGLPVVFGPRFGKFAEARELVAAGGFFSVKNSGELAVVLKKLEDPIFYEKASAAVRSFLEREIQTRWPR